MELRTPLLLREPPRSRTLGLFVSIGSVALCTAAIYPLKTIAPAVSLGVVYLLAVIGVSVFWGFRLGLFTAVLSAAAFNFFHIPPVGRFTIADSRNWVALVAFFVTAAIASTLAELGRARRPGGGFEAPGGGSDGRARPDPARPPQRRCGAAGRGGTDRDRARAALSRAPTRRSARASGETLAASSHDRETSIGTLVLPAGIDPETLIRVRERFVPGLEALLAAAIDHEALIGATVETEALRRSDDIKTALLRTVSHDLRTPLTAIRAAASALSSPTITEEDRQELRDAIVEDSDRLASLVDNLLDLSRLRTGSAEPSRDWTSIEEVIEAALDDLALDRDRFRLSIDEQLPFIRADSAQLERAFVNLLSNAARYSGGEPVSVRAREVSGRLVIRVVDQGPGIPERELERIFEAFYRGAGSDSHSGAGLGLAIVRGFVEANGGQVSVESLPGQGTAFVVEFPLGGDAASEQPRPASAAPAGR